jgi:hypothetical protein
MHFMDRAMAYAAGFLFLTAKDRLFSQANARGICGEQSSIKALIRVLGFCLSIIIAAY